MFPETDRQYHVIYVLSRSIRKHKVCVESERKEQSKGYGCQSNVGS